LGIVLFLIEIVYFILRPVAHELQRWWKDRGSIRSTQRSRWTVACAGTLALLAILPWSTRISVPAVVEAAVIARVYPQRGGDVEEVRVKAGDTVRAGDVLVVLRSAEIDHQIALTTGKIALLQMRLARRSSDSEDRSNSLVNEQELRALSSELRGLRTERNDSTIRAPEGGMLAEFNSTIHAGRTIGRTEFVALIRGGGSVVRGYISQDDISRLGRRNAGRFVADLPGWPSLDVELQDIARSGAATIETPELASQHGGPIAVRPHAGDGSHRRLIPVKANYLATMLVAPGGIAPDYSARGVVILQGDAESSAGRAWRQIAAVLVRESGF
jgi:putative peptide zinc metalloprotease protein